MPYISIESDAKTSKSVQYGWLTGITYFAPHTEAGGRNMCPMTSEACIEACLSGAGMAGIFPSIKRSRVERTQEYLRDPAGFMDVVQTELSALRKQAARRRLKPTYRPNGTSDQPKLARAIARRNPDLQVYDYTKIPKPWKRTMANYHLTFSFSGENLADCLAALKHGINVAVVFSGGLPETWNGYQVIDGDVSDLRFLDPIGVIVGLSPKGLKANRMETGGFIQIGGLA